RGVGFEEQAGKLAPGVGRYRGLLLKHDLVAVAPLGDGGGGGPAFGVFEDDDADRLRRLQVRLAEDASERVAELEQSNHGLAGGPLSGLGEDFEWARDELRPRLREPQR